MYWAPEDSHQIGQVAEQARRHTGSSVPQQQLRRVLSLPLSLPPWQPQPPRYPLMSLLPRSLPRSVMRRRAANQAPPAEETIAAVVARRSTFRRPEILKIGAPTCSPTNADLSQNGYGQIIGLWDAWDV